MFLQSKYAHFPIAADCQQRLLKSIKYDDTGVVLVQLLM